MITPIGTRPTFAQYAIVYLMIFTVGVIIGWLAIAMLPSVPVRLPAKGGTVMLDGRPLQLPEHRRTKWMLIEVGVDGDQQWTMETWEVVR